MISHLEWAEQPEKHRLGCSAPDGALLRNDELRDVGLELMEGGSSRSGAMDGRRGSHLLKGRMK
jgi:hypothetical protein